MRHQYIVKWGQRTLCGRGGNCAVGPVSLLGGLQEVNITFKSRAAVSDTTHQLIATTNRGQSRLHLTVVVVREPLLWFGTIMLFSKIMFLIFQRSFQVLITANLFVNRYSLSYGIFKFIHFANISVKILNTQFKKDLF